MSIDRESALELRYEKSIKILIDLALDYNHERARVAADVLLSANSSLMRPRQQWLMSIPELRILSEVEKYAALGVIHGRVSLAYQPAAPSFFASINSAKPPAYARQALGTWFRYYNEQRPHQALGMKTPRKTYKLAA